MQPFGPFGLSLWAMPRRPKALCACVLFLCPLAFSLGACGGPPAADVPSGDSTAVSAIAREAEARTQSGEFAGVVLVAREGQILLHRAYGVADRATGAPMELDTKLRIGSINKMFTGVAVLKLVNEGAVALDAPIGTYLTDYPDAGAAAKVTVRHLLTNTGGTGDFFGPGFLEQRASLRQHDDYVALCASRPLAFEPGAGHAYSNCGFVLLGAIIERVTGRSYYDAVRESVFGPANMPSTDSLPEADAVPGRAPGYTRRDGGPWASNVELLPLRGTAAGGGYSTAEDLFHFTEALRDGRLVPHAVFEEATRRQAECCDGYGFSVFDRGDAPWYGHGGGAPGMNGAVRVYPENGGYVVVVLSNLDPPSADALADTFQETLAPGSTRLAPQRARAARRRLGRGRRLGEARSTGRSTGDHEPTAVVAAWAACGGGTFSRDDGGGAATKVVDHR